MTPPGQRTTLVLRSLVALVVGSLVAFLSLLAVWADMKDVKAIQWEGVQTRQKLKSLAIHFEAYQGNDSVSQESWTNFMASLQNPRAATDGWGRAFVFTHRGTDWEIGSYGRDGRKGGTGADSDVTHRDSEPADPMEPPGFYEFAFQLRLTQAATISTLVCGVLAGLLSFFTIRIPALTQANIVRAVLMAVVTLIAATFIAATIAGLHVPHH